MNRRLVMVLVFAALVGLIASFFVYQVVRQVAMSGGPEGTEPVYSHRFGKLSVAWVEPGEAAPKASAKAIRL